MENIENTLEDKNNELNKNITKEDRIYSTGKRKNSTARIWLKKGTGKIQINGKSANIYFARPVLRMIINQPFETINSENIFDAYITVKGGGLSGQAGAIRHGISKALSTYDNNFRHALKKIGFLTRDPRVVERKKFGLAKARRSYQFSKR